MELREAFLASKLFGNGGGGGGGGANTDLPIKFIDYDGTILYSYSAADFLALDTLPELVSHEGMAAATAWNWSLANAKTYVTTYGALIIGQEYARTELDIELVEGLSPYLELGIDGTVTVDWGDGNSENMTGTRLTTACYTQHTYAVAGNYTIKITVVNGNYQLYGNSYHPILNANAVAQISPPNFAYASCVKGVRIASGIAVMNYAFYWCTNLKSVTIPSGVTSIGQYALYNCVSLEYVSIPGSVTSLGSNLFYTCRSLSSVTIPSGVTSIGQYDFYGCSNLKVVIIPNGVTSIAGYAFNSCYNLKSITLPSGLTGIGENAFKECTAMEEIAIPSSVTSLGNSAFNGCSKLKSIIIPKDVTSLGNYVFGYCYGFTSMTILATTPPTLGNNGFYNVADFVIYVPNGKLSAYQGAANWSTYASNMKELPA